MRNLELRSIDFPELSESAKRLINNGVWYFYKVTDASSFGAEYFLIANQSVYTVNSNGHVLSEQKRSGFIYPSCDTVYFVDLEMPGSLSNLQLSWV